MIEHGTQAGQLTVDCGGLDLLIGCLTFVLTSDGPALTQSCSFERLHFIGRDLIERHVFEITEQRDATGYVTPVGGRVGSVLAFRPGEEVCHCGLKRRNLLPLSDPHFALRKGSTVGRLNLASNARIALLCNVQVHLDIHSEPVAFRLTSPTLTEAYAEALTGIVPSGNATDM